MRTDADIALSADLVLQCSTDVPLDHVKVMVEKGWLTLTGEVEWDYQRQSAATAVSFLMGVTGLSNLISIGQTTAATVVKSDIEAALKRRAAFDSQRIGVDISGRDVTLSGTVHSCSERELARNSAWGAPGVRNVVDNLVVAH
jgi:osmotically-inducible protein OsmY